jgi:hypothetical protein
MSPPQLRCRCPTYRRKESVRAFIEAANIPDALLKAKKWAASVEVADNSLLQILLDGRSVRSLKPGSF